MRKILFLSVLLVVIFGVRAPVYATKISCDMQNLGGDIWLCGYTVNNDTLTDPIMEFKIYFEYGLYQGLWVESTVSDWTVQVLDPGYDTTTGPYSGYYDAIADDTGISPGNKLSGFQLSFEWLGVFGSPVEQTFDVYGENLTSLGSGQTTSTVVPEPGTLMLLCSGLLCLANIRRKPGAK